MRIGILPRYWPDMSLDDVLQKLRKLDIDTVELGTGNYPGDPHCKLSMLEQNGDSTRSRRSSRTTASPSAR